MEAFQLSAASAGLLMSLFAITGLILALPSGFIFQRWGHRLTGLIAIGSLILGASLGAISRSMETMLTSRFIEGAGMSFMSVVAPAIIAMWFKAEQRGRAMGIWAIWVPLGSTMMFMIAPLMASWWQWPGVWWFGSLYTLCVGLLYYIFIPAVPAQGLPESHMASSPKLTGRDLKGVLANRNLWLISFLFGCFNFVFIAFVTWAPTFLHEVRGTSLAYASLLVSATTILALVSCPLAGWISDKLGSRRGICLIPMVLMAFLFPLSSSVPVEMFLLLAIALGFIGGFVPPGVFSAAVEVVGDERLSGMAMAVILIGQNAGMLLGPLLFGWMVGSLGGWQVAFGVLAPISALGALAAWLSKMR